MTEQMSAEELEVELEAQAAAEEDRLWDEYSEQCPECDRFVPREGHKRGCPNHTGE